MKLQPKLQPIEYLVHNTRRKIRRKKTAANGDGKFYELVVSR